MSNSKRQQYSHLSLEERDILSDIDSTTLKVLMKDLESHVLTIEAALITFQYRPGKEKELAHLKSKAQGARELLHSYQTRLKTGMV